MKTTDVSNLMAIYGIGYILIYLLFSLMYSHALKKAGELELSPGEIFDTKTKLYKYFVLIGVGVLSVIVAFFVPPDMAGIAGLIYILIGPALTFFYSRRGKLKRKLKI
jgi:hypothetical protein